MGVHNEGAGSLSLAKMVLSGKDPRKGKGGGRRLATLSGIRPVRKKAPHLRGGTIEEV